MVTDPSPADDAVSAAITSAKSLADQGRPLEAIGRLNALLADGERRADLLGAIAELEEAADLLDAAFEHMREAVASEPRDSELLANWALMQLRAGLFRESLATLAEVPGDLTDDAYVRAVRAQVYRWAGLYALAADARRRRSAMWWATGGPVSFVRKRLRRLDEAVMATWRRWSEELFVLHTLRDGSVRLTTTLLRAEIEAANLAWARQDHWIGALRRLHARLGKALLLLLTWGLLLARLSPSSAGLPALVAAAGAGTVVAWLSLPLFTRLVYRGGPVAYLVFWRRFVPVGLLVGVVGGWLITAGGHESPVRAIGLGAAAGPLLFLAFRGADQAIVLAGVFWRAHLTRTRPRAMALDSLFTLISEMKRHDARGDLRHRMVWMYLIEYAARCLERDLVAFVRGYDQHTREVIAEHLRGASWALRALKKDIALPSPGSWERVEAELSHAFTALADGDLGGLRTIPRPAGKRRPASRWSKTVAAARALAVAATPLAATVALQRLVSLDSGHYHWAKVVTAGWAVLYLLISVDPTLREKIEVAGDLLSLARGQARPDQKEHQPPGQSPR